MTRGSDSRHCHSFSSADKMRSISLFVLMVSSFEVVVVYIFIQALVIGVSSTSEDDLKKCPANWNINRTATQFDKVSYRRDTEKA